MLYSPDCQRIVFAHPTFLSYLPLAEAQNKDRILGSLVDKIDPFFSSDIFRPAQNYQRPREIPAYPPPIGTSHPTQEIQSPRAVSASPGLAERLFGLPSESSSGLEGITRQTTLADEDMILHNSKGQRIDPPIEFQQEIRNKLAGWTPKLCNNHHLRGCCAYGSTCGYQHGSLTKDYRNALRALAREQPCRSGNDCKDPECYAGHRCPRNKRCGRACRFQPAMHIKDTRTVIASEGCPVSASATFPRMGEASKM